MEYNKIVIYRDGATTKANAYINKQLIKSARAVCSPSDTYDFATGAAIAFERLMKPDEHTYKTGDKVRISSKGKRPINCFNVGEVVTVVKYELNDYGCKRAVDGRFQWVNEDELEPYTEPAQRTVTINGTPILPAQPDNGEVVKLYCIRDCMGRATKGKVYKKSPDGWITMDDGLRDPYDDDYMNGFPFSSYFIPLVKRPANVGEWVYVDSDSVDGADRGEICQVVAINEMSSDNKPYIRTKHETVYGYEGISPCTLIRHIEYLVLSGYQPEPEQPKGWSGSVVCTKSGMYHTVDKIYKVVDGYMNSDEEKTYNDVPYTSVENINERAVPKFSEVKIID